MRIENTFIVLIEGNQFQDFYYVKIHLVRNKDGSEIYFKEYRAGNLERLDTLEGIDLIKKVF